MQIRAQFLQLCLPTGHLTLLRSTMVNASTQAVVAKDLDMATYIIYNSRDGMLYTHYTYKFTLIGIHY